MALVTWLERTWKDGAVAAQRLRRTPAFAVPSVLTLGLALGANAAIFAVLQSVVLNPLPYPEANRLIALEHRVMLNDQPQSGLPMTPGLYFHYMDRARTLEGLAIYGTSEQTVTGGSTPERIRVTRTTASLARVMGVMPAHGRWFAEEEAQPGAAQVAVLSNGFWQRRYGGAPDVIGSTIALDAVPTEVIGVMPPEFAFPDPRVDVWIPDQSTRSIGFGVFSHSGVARMREGVTLEATRAELTRLIAELPEAYPGIPGAISLARTFKAVSSALTLQEAIVGNAARAIWLLLLSVGLLLLVAWVNVANLFLVRYEQRQREVAVRRALGAGRTAIVRLFMAESVLLAAAGGLLAVALAWSATRVLVAFGPASLPRLENLRLDAATVAFTLALTLTAGVAFGLISLLRKTPLTLLFQEAGRGSTSSRRGHRARLLLAGAQVAMAFVLLVFSGLMLRSFQELQRLDPGFDPTSTLTFRVGLPARTYPTREAAVATHSAIIERLSALPGVTAVSASTCLPLPPERVCFGNILDVRGEERAEGTAPRPAAFAAVAGGYVEAMGMRLLRGRSIERGDVERGERVVVVNEALVDTYLRGRDPIGAQIAPAVGLVETGASAEWLTVVGVVANTAGFVLAEPSPLPQLYMPMSVAGGPGLPVTAGPYVSLMSYVVRAAVPVPALLDLVRREIDRVDADLAIAQVRTLQETLDGASVRTALMTVLLGVAATVALLLGAVGIYGVIAFLVTQRTSEIGVRMALGAEPAAVSAMVVRQGALVTIAGLAVGAVTALGAGRLIESQLYGIGPRDVGVFAGTTLGVLAAALVASWLPARRAARLNPVEALRMS